MRSRSRTDVGIEQLFVGEIEQSFNTKVAEVVPPYTVPVRVFVDKAPRINNLDNFTGVGVLSHSSIRHENPSVSI
jgi:hypothetical protein